MFIRGKEALHWQIWTVFAMTETWLCLTPGLAVLLVLSRGFARGTAALIRATLGILAGNAAYFILSATSLVRCSVPRSIYS
jgi:homoserine/homoserine lactone efflux protein